MGFVNHFFFVVAFNMIRPSQNSFIDMFIADARRRIDEDGRCYIHKGGTWVESHVSRAAHGYYSISYHKRSLFVHRIVYRKYHGPLIQGLVINHLDGNKINNHWTNLEQVTPRENWEHAEKNGLAPPLRELWKRSRWKKVHDERLLQEHDFRSKNTAEIIRRVEDGCTLNCIAKRLGVTKQRIHAVRRNYFEKDNA